MWASLILLEWLMWCIAPEAKLTVYARVLYSPGSSRFRGFYCFGTRLSLVDSKVCITKGITGGERERERHKALVSLDMQSLDRTVYTAQRLDICAGSSSIVIMSIREDVQAILVAYYSYGNIAVSEKTVCGRVRKRV